MQSTLPRAAAKRPPGPKPRFPGEFLLQSRDMRAVLERLARTYGDASCLETGRGSLYFFNHPDAVREVLQTKSEHFAKGRALEFAKMVLGEGLLTSEDPLHRQQRQLMQPAFHHKRVRTYADSMTHYGVQMRDGWRDGQTIDIHSEMMALALAIVAKTLFNTEIGASTAAIEGAINAVLPLFRRAFLPWGDLLNLLPLPATLRYNRAKTLLDTTIARMISEHKSSGDVGDLMSMLLLARDENGAPMSDQQVTDEALTAFLAGHETTANALTYTFFLLASHPEIEAKLHEEIERVLGNRAPTMDDVPQLTYTAKIFAESMRLYPPVWWLGRRAISDCEIFGYPVAAGTTIVMSQWMLHRDARFWPDPLRFNPENFSDEAKASRPKFAYFPFGSGPRTCIGEAFASMEGAILVATLAQKWRMKLVSDAPLELEAMITMRPKNAVWMRLERRS